MSIGEGNILEVAENAIVSPANSYGFMDGGIDRQYTEYFGLKPQEELQNYIATRKEGYLPVGSACVVTTGDGKIPYMVCAPTMMGPEAVRPSNCFFAMSAVLNAAKRHGDTIKQLYCPGLATSIGQVAEVDAANEMARAYNKWVCRNV